jgi:hypothetical protein
MSCDCNTLVVGEAGVQGPQGLAGINGTSGVDGINAFTTLSASFTQPAINVSVNFNVVENRWIAIGQTIYISNAGFYRVTSLGGSPYSAVTAVLVKTDGIVSPSVVSSGLKVSPSSSALYTAPLASLDVTGTSSLDGAVTVNSSGAAVDFRVASDTQANLIVANGSLNSVGIGLFAPSATLEVAGTMKVQSTAQFLSGATVNVNQADSDFSVRTQNFTNTLYVDASTDRVGIGTSSPSKLLDVEGAAEINTVLVNPGGVASIAPTFQVLGTGSTYPITVKSTSGPTFNGVGIFNTAPTVALDVTGETKISGNVSVGSDVLKVNAAGTFVGINKGIPTVSLDVVGDSKVSGTLNVIGGTTLTSIDAGSINLTGAASVGTTLGVTGAATLSSSLGVDGAASINGNLTVGSNILKVNSSFGRVGINQGSPTTSLDVNGDVKIATDLTVNDSFYAVNSSGFIGINDSTPSYSLDVNGSTRSNDYRATLTAGHSDAKLTKFLFGTGSGTFALDSGHNNYFTVGVTGAVVGNFVQVAYSSVPSTTPEKITLFGYVSSSDTVTVVVANTSNSNISTSQTYSVNVLVTGAAAS